MLENFIYENHLGQRFVGLEHGIYLNSNELRNYSWDYDVINNRISRFYRSVKTRKLPLVVCCSTTEEANEAKNRLMEITEADVEAIQPGTIYTGDYYITGFITESKKSDYRVHGRTCKIDLTLTSQTAWSKETVHVFGSTDEGAAASRSGFDFPFDYAYDYSVSTASRQIVNDTIKGSNFKLKIYGEATDPAVMINGHAYKVNGMIRAGETLLIDSLNKTVVLTTASGTKINWFNNRDRHDYIFEPIPPGVNNVIYNGAFKFDLTIIEERSEPRWI